MQALERQIVHHDWITALFVLCMLLMVAAKYLYPQRFQDFIGLMGSNKFIVYKGKENKAFHGFNIWFFIVHLISVSIFLYMGYLLFIKTDTTAIQFPFIRIFTAYGCFVLLKFAVEKIIGNIFNLDNQIDYYLFQKISYRNFISLFLLVATVLLVYSLPESPIIFWAITALVLLANAIALTIIYKKNSNLLAANWFYFILYLCALEIAPYFILYKLITI